MKKRKLKLKKDNFLILILSDILIVSTIDIILFLVDIKTNNDNNKKIIEDVTIDNKHIDKNNNKKNNNNKEINFNKLLSINEDTKGWIKYNNDKINYPIVQSNDNSYYLKKSFDGKTNQSGTIFMDYRNKSFSDKNVVIFGHAMTDGSMFGSLKDVFKKDFFDNKENNYIKIIDTDNQKFIYQIFSYYIIEKEEYYITTSFDNDSSFNKFINTISKRSYKNFKIKVTKDDNILTLSTCSGTGNTTKRKVVHAKLIKNNVT